MKRSKAVEIYADGYQLDQWACDEPEGSNSGDEHLMEYEDEYYLIVTDSDDVVSGSKINLKEQEEEGGFIWDLIQEFEKRK